MKKCFLLYFLVTIAFSCKDSTADQSTGSNVISITTTKDKYADLSKFFDIITIEIDAETFRKVGGRVREFFYANEELTLIRRYPAIITCLTKTGEIKWQLTAQEDDFRSFNTIDVVKYDNRTGVLTVYDSSKSAFMLYDSNGEFLNTKPFKLNINDYHVTSSGHYLFDVSEYRTEYEKSSGPKIGIVSYSDLEASPKILSYQSGFQDKKLPFTDYKNFIEADAGLFYHHDFSDTIFRISNERFVQPAYVISFDENLSSRDVYTNASVFDKYSYALEEGVSLIDYIAIHKGVMYTVYSKYYDTYLAAVDIESKEQLFNSDRFVCDGIALTVPQDQRGKSFLVQTSDFMYDHLQSIKDDDFNASPEQKNRLQQIENERGDLIGMVYNVITFK